MRLVARSLACRRGGRPVFADVSFEVAGGEMLAVLGPNGAGKSSLLRALAGLVPLDAGTLALEGGTGERTLGEQCHYAGHADALKPALTALETLAFWRDVLGEPWLDPAQALERFAIGHLADLPSGYFSAGQRRRLALARLFVARRPVWLLDEPTAALDVATQALLAGHLAAHLAEGGLVLAATHGDLGLPARVLEIGA